MDGRHVRVVAKKIASVLSTEEATLFEMKECFERAKNYLRVAYEEPKSTFGRMYFDNPVEH